MGKLAAAANVYNTCLRILRAKGYTLSSDKDDFIATKNGYTFYASNPIELLGLTVVYEFKGEPTERGKPYWWVVEGDDIYDEL